MIVYQPPEEEQGKRRHQSEQSSRVRRAGGGEDKTPLKPLVREGGASVEGEGAGGGRAREEGAVCGCWCSGWCEVMVRRPSGVTSWVARVQNGLLSSQPQVQWGRSGRRVVLAGSHETGKGLTFKSKTMSVNHLRVDELEFKFSQCLST